MQEIYCHYYLYGKNNKNKHINIQYDPIKNFLLWENWLPLLFIWTSTNKKYTHSHTVWANRNFFSEKIDCHYYLYGHQQKYIHIHIQYGPVETSFWVQLISNLKSDHLKRSFFQAFHERRKNCHIETYGQ